MLFMDYVERWKSECRLNISKSWAMTQDQVIAAHILPLLGHKWLASSKTYTHRDGVDFLKRIAKKIA